jgi:hypothetical protein
MLNHCNCNCNMNAPCEWCDLFYSVSDDYKSSHGIRPRWIARYSLAQLRQESLRLRASMDATRPERLMPLHGDGWAVAFAGADVPAARERLMAQAGIDPAMEW